jgi:hypothetical protein
MYHGGESLKCKKQTKVELFKMNVGGQWKVVQGVCVCMRGRKM